MSVFGPIRDAAQIEDAIADLIRTWHDTYLVAAERANGEQVRRYPRLRHWRVDHRLRIAEEDVTPLLVVVSPGEPDEPQDTGDEDGTLTSDLDLRAAIYVESSSPEGSGEETRIVARRWGAAIATLLQHKANTLDDVTLVGLPRQVFDELASTENYSLGVVYVVFRLRVYGVRARAGGPAVPYPDPDSGHPVPDDPDQPVIDTVNITIDPLEED